MHQSEIGKNSVTSLEHATPRYVLVTPVKNEKEYLPQLINSIKSQTIKPVLWVIVDDESTDGTHLLLKQLQNEVEFVKVISSEEGKRNASIDRYGFVVRKGIDFGTKTCKLKNIDFDYIGLADADLLLDSSYFAKVIASMERNRNVGMASGAFLEKIGNDFVLRQGSSNKSDFTAAGMLIRRKCYDQAGGFPTAVGPEFILSIKTLYHGYQIKSFPNALGIHMRQSGQKIGQWKGFLKCGEIHYMLNFLPIDALLLVGYFTFSRPYAVKGPTISGLAFLAGYLNGFFSRKPKIPDPVVIAYFQKNLNNSLKNFLSTISYFLRKKFTKL